MTSQNKKAKTDKRKHPGIDRHFLKITDKLKRVCLKIMVLLAFQIYHGIKETLDLKVMNIKLL